MSVSHTEAAVVARTKTVTRRLGWTFLKPGDRLTLCRKVMGRREGEPLVRLAEVEIVSVRREPLYRFPAEDILREGVPVEHFGGQTPTPFEWVDWFRRAMGCHVMDNVTRIEWRYLS